jgi:hypothetical protein
MARSNFHQLWDAAHELGTGRDVTEAGRGKKEGACYTHGGLLADKTYGDGTRSGFSWG